MTRVNKSIVTPEKRMKLFEEQFKKRYNRDIEVYTIQTLTDKGYLEKVENRIISPNKKQYKIIEFLKDNATEYSIVQCQVGKRDVEKKFRTYLESEIFVADDIGEEVING